MNNNIYNKIPLKEVCWTLLLNTGAVWVYFGLLSYNKFIDLFFVLQINFITLIYTLLFWSVIVFFNYSPSNSKWKDKNEIKNFLSSLAVSVFFGIVFLPFVDFETLFQYLLLLSATITFGCLCWVFLKDKERLRERQELESRVQLDALQRKVNPHFLFNSLNALSSLIKLDKNKAEEMCLDLADLCRAIVKINDSKVTIEDELGFLNKYISIEKIRFGEKLKVNFNVKIKEKDSFEVPLLISQPIVENSINYCSYNKENIKEVDVLLYSTDDEVLFEVRNLFDEKYKNKNGLSEGVKLTFDRLKLFYGNKACFESKTDRGGDNAFWVSSIKIKK